MIYIDVCAWHCMLSSGLLTILAKSIANNDTNTIRWKYCRYQYRYYTNTDTFAKSIGDTSTPILLPILLMLLLAIMRYFTVFKSVCEDYYFVKHARTGSNKCKRNIIKLNESAEDVRSLGLRARKTDSFSCWYFLPFSTVSSMRLYYTSL